VSINTTSASGALTVLQTGNMTGAYISTRATSATVLVLESIVNSQTGSAKAPHLLFGYKGNFDVSLYRSSGARPDQEP
jgi:hypothetical protein